MSKFNEDELLLRQVHPSFIQEGRVTSVAFRPTPKDQKKLSVNRGSLISPKESFELHTNQKNLQSAGVWGVSVREVYEMSEITLEEDPVSEPFKDPSHALINFSKIDSESRVKTISSKLADKARSRGCLFSFPEKK